MKHSRRRHKLKLATPATGSDTDSVSDEWAEALAARIAYAIDPGVTPDNQSWDGFAIRHALRVRIYELERDAAILKSRLRATVDGLVVPSLGRVR
jgi:hypothetical protein